MRSGNPLTYTSVWTSDNTNLGTYFQSASTTTYFDWTQIFEPNDGENAVVATKGDGVPIYKVLTPTYSEWSVVSDFISHESSAQFVESFDNRLIFFNTATEGGVPTTRRVWWSVRGDPLDFTSTGAGFEDLLDMKGHGTGIIAEEDRLVLFSNEEVWEARPRRDAYAFDFNALTKVIGNAYPRSAAKTDIGIIWLGPDFKFYRAQGGIVRPFSPDVQRYLKTNFREPTECWATFVPSENQYRFFFSTTTGLSATNAFYLNTEDVATDRMHPEQDKGNWMLQNFKITSASSQYQANCGDDVFIGTDGRDFNDKYQFLETVPTQLGDGGNVQTYRWKSHGLSGSKFPNQFEGISEILIDLQQQAASNFSLGVSISTNLGASFISGSVINVGPTGDPDTVFLPVQPTAARKAMFETHFWTGGTDTSHKRFQNYEVTLRPWSGRRPY